MFSYSHKVSNVLDNTIISVWKENACWLVWNLSWNGTTDTVPGQVLQAFKAQTNEAKSTAMWKKKWNKLNDSTVYVQKKKKNGVARSILINIGMSQYQVIFQHIGIGPISWLGQNWAVPFVFLGEGLVVCYLFGHVTVIVMQRRTWMKNKRNAGGGVTLTQHV